MATPRAITLYVVAGAVFATCMLAKRAAANVVSPAKTAPAIASSIDKKARYLADKVAAHKPSVGGPQAPALRRAARRRPTTPLVNLHNLWTREWLAVEVPRRGEIAQPATATVRTFLRCHFTEEAVPTLDARPLLLALEAAQHFKVARIDVISGYRSPKYNLMLRKKGREVARDSQHTKGNAIDIRLPDIAPRALARWARAKKLGGVGIYRTSGFVHLDSGPIRAWTGR